MSLLLSFVTDADTAVNTEMYKKNRCINKLYVSGGLKNHHPHKISSILSSPNMEKRLFRLLVTKLCFEAVLKWMSKKLCSSNQSRSHHITHISHNRFFAYIGLALATNLIKYNDIWQYWSDNALEGHPVLKNTMSHKNLELVHFYCALQTQY